MFVAEPSVPTDATDVLPHLDSDDRNIRVAALRVLAFCDGPAAADGILRGLDDPMRRVRNVAAKSSVRFLDDPRIVELYFYDERTQQEIAAELGVSQQVVSRQLFGVIRDGRRIGGAVSRLRKACEKIGVDPEKWV